MNLWTQIKLEDLSNIAKEVRDKYFKKNTIILLNGEMGSGKTTFLKFIFHEYSVTSPSFVHALYYGDDFMHIDAYTLNKEQLLNLSLEDVLEDKCIVVEWGNLIQDMLKKISDNIIVFEFKFYDNIHYFRMAN